MSDKTFSLVLIVCDTEPVNELIELSVPGDRQP